VYRRNELIGGFLILMKVAETSGIPNVFTNVLGDYQVQWLVKTYKDKIMQSFINNL